MPLNMNTVSISSRFQVVIPQAIRQEMKLRPGSKMRAIHYRGRVVLITVRSMESMRGAAVVIVNVAFSALANDTDVDPALSVTARTPIAAAAALILAGHSGAANRMA